MEKLESTYVGVDIGQQRDYTAIAVIERYLDPAGHSDYHVRHLGRLPLKLDYTRQVDLIIDIVQKMKAQQPDIVVDVGGVGRPILDLLTSRGISVQGIQLTAGDVVTENGATMNVPKRDIVMALELLFEQKRIRIPASLRHKDLLLAELQNFTVKTTSAGHDSYNAARESIHDDMVIALALPVWYAERKYRMAGRLGDTSWMQGRSYESLYNELGGGRPDPVNEQYELFSQQGLGWK